MNHTASILGLVKKNNGFFKSEKQANFLIEVLKNYGGLVGHTNSGYHTCQLFANWDEKGITKITKHRKNKIEVTFERSIPGQLNDLEKKEIKRFERKIRSLQKEIKEREESFESGMYNSSGDKSTYTIDMIESYIYFQNQKRDQVLRIENLINDIKNK